MRRFGLIGYPLSHSFSQKFFTEKFQREHITGCVYENFPIADISELPGILQQYPVLEGLNVTIPYKERVIPFLHHQDEVVQAIGACNCIRIKEGKLFGFNTDVAGFEVSLDKLLQPYHKKALVLGTGGAAKAVHYVLKKRGIEFIEVSRNPQGRNQISYADVDAVMHDHLLIVNTTPLGMYPNVEEFPPIAYDMLTPRHYLFDLIYNPPATAFLKKGEEKGALVKNGGEMLVIQAEESWKIWNRD
jgi:Shikimate 5-dehydrogenase